MKCSKCGFDNNSELDICQNCGASLKDEVIEIEVNQNSNFKKYCNNCGREINAGDTVCANCGKQLNEPVNNPQPVEETEIVDEAPAKKLLVESVIFRVVGYALMLVTWFTLLLSNIIAIIAYFFGLILLLLSWLDIIKARVKYPKYKDSLIALIVYIVIAFITVGFIRTMFKLVSCSIAAL